MRDRWRASRHRSRYARSWRGLGPAGALLVFRLPGRRRSDSPCVLPAKLPQNRGPLRDGQAHGDEFQLVRPFVDIFLGVRSHEIDSGDSLQLGIILMAPHAIRLLTTPVAGVLD